MRKFDKALHDLICSTLRGEHIRDMKLRELQQYNYHLGVALHNIPEHLRNQGELPLECLNAINMLDPTGSDSRWGEWCTQFSSTIGQELPGSPYLTAVNE